MDAWIDCMTYLDAPNSGMTSIHCAPPEVVTMLLEDVDRLPEDLYGLIQSCAALVNWRRVELGEPPVLAVACDRSIR